MKDKGKTNYKENHVFFAVYFGCDISYTGNSNLLCECRGKVNLAINDDGNVHCILPYLQER